MQERINAAYEGKFDNMSLYTKPAGGSFYNGGAQGGQERKLPVGATASSFVTDRWPR